MRLGERLALRGRARPVTEVYDDAAMGSEQENGG